MLPLYDAGLIERFSPSSGAHALAWHAVKLVVMNCGWLLLGLGLALHAQVFSISPPPRKLSPSPRLPPVNSLLETIVFRGLLFDALGVVGLGLLGIAAVRLARRHRSWGGTMMALGAVSLLIARLYFVLAPHFLDNDMLVAIGPVGISLTIALPPLFCPSASPESSGACGATSAGCRKKPAEDAHRAENFAWPEVGFGATSSPDV